MVALTKGARQRLVLEILKENPAQSQQGLQREMGRRGLKVSQITISRDLRDLGVAKVAVGGARRYASGQEAVPADPERLKRVLREFVRSMEAAGQFVVIKTPPSGAQPVGLALDQAALPEIAGTIAGDDTIFVLLRSAAHAPKVLRYLRGLAS